MAECSVHDVNVWSPRGLCLQSSYQGFLNYSTTSTLKRKVEYFAGSSEICNGGEVTSKKGYELVGKGEEYIEGPSSNVERVPLIKENGQLGTLIPGLPDDVAKSCMSLVPRMDLPAMGRVSKSWKTLLQSKEFHMIRKDAGTLEEWLYALTLSEDRKRTCWHVLCALQNEWKVLPPMPGPLKTGSGFTVIDGKLLVIGGAVDDSKELASSDVILYDSALNRWRKIASMHTPRYEFACAVLNGLVYVAGGHGVGGKNLTNVEVYDPEQDEWTILPSLKKARWGCFGSGLDGKLYVMAGRSSFTIGHSRCVDVYDPVKGQWEEAKNGCMMVLTHAIVDQELFCIEWKNDRKLAIFNAAENLWKQVSLPLAGSLSVGFYLANLGHKLLLFPTKMEVPCDTFVYDPHTSSGSEWQTTEIMPLESCLCCIAIEA